MNVKRKRLVISAATLCFAHTIPVIATGVTGGLTNTSNIGSADIHGIKRQAIQENRVYPDQPYGDANRAAKTPSTAEITDKCQQTSEDASADCDAL